MKQTRLGFRSNKFFFAVSFQFFSFWFKQAKNSTKKYENMAILICKRYKRLLSKFHRRFRGSDKPLKKGLDGFYKII